MSFEPGEFVVCVDASMCAHPQLRAGAIYIVSKVCTGKVHFESPKPSVHQGCLDGLQLVEIPLGPAEAFASSRFDKYIPETGKIVTKKKESV
jgi:hypothetical protein